MAEQNNGGPDQGAEREENIPPNGATETVNIHESEIPVEESGSERSPKSKEYKKKAQERAIIFYETLHDKNPDLKFWRLEICFQNDTVFSISLKWKHKKTGIIFAISSATDTRSLDKYIIPWPEQCKWDAERFVHNVTNQITGII